MPRLIILLKDTKWWYFYLIMSSFISYCGSVKKKCSILFDYSVVYFLKKGRISIDTWLLTSFQNNDLILCKCWVDQWTLKQCFFVMNTWT